MRPALSSFYKQLYAAVDDPSLDSVISWSKSNKSFILWNPKEFRPIALQRMLCVNLKIFYDDLKDYGFKRVKVSEHPLEFGHDQYFVRGKPELMKVMEAEAYDERLRKTIKAIKAKKAKAKKALKARDMQVAASFTNLTL